MGTRAFFAAIGGVLGICTSASGAVQAPYAGAYLASFYVQYANGNLNCLDVTGEQYRASVSYSGLGGTTNYIRMPFLGNYEAAEYVWQFTVTRGAGTLAPSGDFNWHNRPYHDEYASGKFSASIMEVGTHAFLMQLSESYDGCYENVNVSLVRVSGDQ